MAMSCVITEPERVRIKKITFTWETGTATATGTTLNVAEGKLVAAMAIPDQVSPPTDNYDITLLDADGHDVLLGAGTNMNGGVGPANDYLLNANLGAVANSRLTLNIAAAGNGTKGVFAVWIQ